MFDNDPVLDAAADSSNALLKGPRIATAMSRFLPSDLNLAASAPGFCSLKSRRFSTPLSCDVEITLYDS